MMAPLDLIAAGAFGAGAALILAARHLRLALIEVRLRADAAEAELARLRAARSAAVSRGNRTRAQRNRALVLAMAEDMKRDMAAKAASAKEAEQADPAQIPLGIEP